jgi:glyoxylase-like metal-dependent hydrolase (beta-lactamase superfamily II)
MTPEVAKDWYEVRELDGGVFHIWEPHVHPFARCNIWYVQGRDRDLLIDSGVGLSPLKPILPTTSGRPIVAVATHVHFDHIGCHHEFDDRQAHAAEADAFEAMPDEVTLAHLFRELENGVSALPSSGWDRAKYRIEPAPIHRTLQDGDTIELGDRNLTVLHLPGHSPGSIGFFEANTGTLFSGDALYDGELIDSFPSSNVENYRQTMERLGKLSIVCGHGGHGPSFSNDRKDHLVSEYLAGLRRQGCPSASFFE